MHFRSFGRHNDSDTVCLASAGFMTGAVMSLLLLVIFPLPEALRSTDFWFSFWAAPSPAPGVAALAAVPWLGALAAGQADAAALAGWACVCPAGRGAGVQLLCAVSGV